MSSSGIPLPEAPHLLVIRLGAMGDVIHTLPAAALLRRELPNAEITWAVQPRWAPLLAGNPAVDSILEVPLDIWRKKPFKKKTLNDFWRFRDKLRASRFDVSVDFQGLLKSAILGRLSKAPTRIGFERASLREPLAARFYTHPFPVRPRHVVDKNLALAQAVTGSTDECSSAVYLPSGERSSVLPLGDFLLASPLAGWKAKQWPPERYADLAALSWKERGLPVVLDGAPADEPILRGIAGSAPPGACVVHVSSLVQLIGATRAARVVLGVDSGPLHLAAALNKPGIALFGPTDPERNGPYGSSFVTLRRPGVETTYKRSDAFSPSMTSFSAEEVWAELSALLDSQTRSASTLSVPS